MPSLNDFLNKKDKEEVYSTLEPIDGLKPCAHCNEDVDGGWWDPEKLIMSWKCSNGHENSYQVG
jgi:hypothetical protein